MLYVLTDHRNQVNIDYDSDQEENIGIRKRLMQEINTDVAQIMIMKQLIILIRTVQWCGVWT